MYGGRDYSLHKNSYTLEEYINYLSKDLRKDSSKDIIIRNILSKNPNALINYFKSGLEAFS